MNHTRVHVHLVCSSMVLYVSLSNLQCGFSRLVAQILHMHGKVCLTSINLYTFLRQVLCAYRSGKVWTLRCPYWCRVQGKNESLVVSSLFYTYPCTAHYFIKYLYCFVLQLHIVQLFALEKPLDLFTVWRPMKILGQ